MACFGLELHLDLDSIGKYIIRIIGILFDIWPWNGVIADILDLNELLVQGCFHSIFLIAIITLWNWINISYFIWIRSSSPNLPEYRPIQRDFDRFQLSTWFLFSNDFHLIGNFRFSSRHFLFFLPLSIKWNIILYNLLSLLFLFDDLSLFWKHAFQILRPWFKIAGL